MKKNAVVIGYGGMGHVHANCYPAQKYVELAAICDPDPQKFKQETVEINTGMKYTVRKNLSPLYLRPSRSARNKEKGSCTNTEKNAITRAFFKDVVHLPETDPLVNRSL